MIRHIDDRKLIDEQKLCRSRLGRKILSYLQAYGTGYDFCRFYLNDGGSVILLINSTMLIDGDSFEKEELQSFVHMYRPFRIEGSSVGIELLYGIDGYRKLHRTAFRLTPDEYPDIDETQIDTAPSLDDVYTILAEGFPNLLDYPMWLTDVSHRVRHGISRVFCYKGSTTASVIYDINGFVLVGQVATKASARGSGYARTLLKWLAAQLEKEGKIALLDALDTRASFYREIGFEVYSDEYVLERIDDNNESAVKGKLNIND